MTQKSCVCKTDTKENKEIECSAVRHASKVHDPRSRSCGKIHFKSQQAVHLLTILDHYKHSDPNIMLKNIF